MKKLKYNTPRFSWMNGLPLGNGRLAAMYWEEADKDIFSLNNEWLTTGIYRERDCEDVSRFLPKVRELITEKKWYEATEMANKLFGGKGGVSGVKGRIDSYKPAGDINFFYGDEIDSGEYALDIEKGVLKIKKSTRGKTILGEFFISCVDDICVFKWYSDEKFSGKIKYTAQKDDILTLKTNYFDDSVEINGKFDGGIEYGVSVKIMTDGKNVADYDAISVIDATCIYVFADVYTENSPKSKFSFERVDYNSLIIRHIEKFLGEMNKVSLELNDSNSKEYTDRLIENVKENKIDNTILKQYFDYGRYLFLSSSICADLPLNLQGKWNYDVNPPWGSDYHFDINVQMCYWAAEALNMSEYTMPLISYLTRIAKNGGSTAKKLYGCRGTVLPLSSDIWAKTAPESCGWAVWIGGAGWMAQHMWTHYLYSGDKAFLQNVAYPYFIKVASFYEDYILFDVDGRCRILPSQSPENRFEGTGDFPVSIGESSAMDVQIAYDSLGYAINAAKILEVDEDKVQIWENIRKNLPEFKIGSDGRLLEWNEEFVEAEPGHRHLSHLYGLYPSDIFNEYQRNEHYEACKKSLYSRLSHGGGHTGWSRAWVSCLMAKIGDREGFFENYSGLLIDFATESMLDLHPPYIFQIDGNIGAMAALIEALISYSGGKVRLLKALPKQWKDGSLKGIKVPGGHTVNVSWKDGKVCEFEVMLGFGDKVIVVAEDREYVCDKDCNVKIK